MSTAPPASPPSLTSLSHGGGCGCKLSPAVLQELLQATPAAAPYTALLVGRETADDAAVWRLNEEQALVATTDFFMPIVDDPFDFGRIAATNALSDVYAMGGRPILALALLAMPVNVLPVTVIREILRGGEKVCAQADIPIAGGHSIDSVEPIYGLVALGLVHPGRLKRNCDAVAEDALILGKPLGVGILSAALRQGPLAAPDYRALIDTTTHLNRAGPELAELDGVHAMTDVTGFGLLGHLLEMCRGSRLGARIDMSRVPLLPRVLERAAAGCRTGASARNWLSYGERVRLDERIGDAHRTVLTDPQTSGGLLIACAAEAVPEALGIFHRHGFAEAAVVGAMSGAHLTVHVEP